MFIRNQNQNMRNINCQHFSDFSTFEETSNIHIRFNHFKLNKTCIYGAYEDVDEPIGILDCMFDKRNIQVEL